MKLHFSFILLLFTLVSFGQERTTATFGEPTDSELKMNTYPEDPDAAGVVLFHQGSYKVEELDRQMKLVKYVHKKIKVLDAKKFKDGDLEIAYYKGKNSTEKVKDIKAVTHNGILKDYVSKSNIFTTDLTTNWKSKKLTFPNIKDGSILEYSYKIESPYFFNLRGWSFQEDLPTLYSEFYTEIPGNFRYNRASFGTHPLAINEVKLKRNCFSLSFVNDGADCESSLYTMENIPAFKEEEYMLSKKNYISRVSYELREYENLRGEKSRYSKSWDDVDKELRTDKELGRQLGSKNFFENNIPATILSMPVNKDKAIALFNFIRNHFTWNNEYRLYSDIEVKDAFKNKKGNISEINLALINALNAGGFKAYMVMGSTRQNGLPTSTYPVITEFNYVFVALVLNTETILLDATRKNAPFGVLPFELLNKQGRLMDFKNDSKWIPITAYNTNYHTVQAQINVDENGDFTGKARENTNGYLAYNQRNTINKKTESTYLKNKETNNINTEISEFSIKNKHNPDEKLEMNYTLSISPETVGDKIILNPFFYEPTFDKNPFKLENRKYPVDFGYPLSNSFNITINLGDTYTVAELPKDVSVSLPNGQGSILLQTAVTNNSVQMRYALSLNNTRFHPNDYQDLKEFFKLIIKTQSQSVLILKKTN